MSAVWQALIPETPSTEPLALQSPDDLNSPSDPAAMTFYNHNNLQNSGYQRVKPLTCDNNNVRRSDIPAPTGLSDPANPDRNATDSRIDKHRAFHRFTSAMNCDQFWRFYTDRFEGRRSTHGETEHLQKRCFLKSGVYNTRQINVFERTRRYIRDIFTTLVDSKWRWTLIVFSFSYIFSWLGFAIVWFLIFLLHGDLDHLDDREWPSCVTGVTSFPSTFLFSLETQHTIGYGTRFMNDNCPDAILLLIIQSITGILIEAFMVGVVFAKLSRPKKRSNTLIFSKNAVISQRDGKNYLMLRVGDLRNRSSVFEAHVRAQVITRRITAEGEVIPMHQQEIKVGGYAEDEDRLLLFWPTIVVHEIDPSSPFYTLSANDLMRSQLELIVVLEGVVESTGMTTQLRTSFLPQEILWGRRFRDLTSYKNETGHHILDFELFNDTFPVETPLCSAQDLDHIKQMKADGGSNHIGVMIPECEVTSVQSILDKPRRHQLPKRSNIELTIINGRGEARRASIDSSDDYGHHPHGNTDDDLNSSADEASSDESDGSKICRLALPGMGNKKRQRSSTCTCSTNVSDSNV